MTEYRNGRHAAQVQERTVTPLEFQIEENLKDSWPAETGFRSTLRKITGIPVPPGKEELEWRKNERKRLKLEHSKFREENHLNIRIRRQKTRNIINGQDTCGFLSVISEKGGVGKTTVSSLLSMVLSKERSTEDIAIVDLNPDKGSLASRMSVETQLSIRDMINYKDYILNGSYNPRDFMKQSPGTRVWVLPGDNTPERRESTIGDDVRTIFQMFAYNFSIAILDNGTGISHSAMEGNLSVSHGMVLVVENTNDAYAFIDSTLNRLEVLGYTNLRSSVVLVVNEKVYLPPTDDSVNAKSAMVTGKDIADAFRGKVRNSVIIPFDPSLARSGPIIYESLLPETIFQVKSLAAALMDDLVVG